MSNAFFRVFVPWAVLLGGCVTPLPPGEDISTLQVDQVRRAASGAAAFGAVGVRWGGTIVRVENPAATRTRLEIVSRPLAPGGRPVHDDRSPGRFIAEIGERLDPAIVKPGRDIGVTGRVSGLRDGRIGRAEYRFPVVAVDAYRYWGRAPDRAAAPYGWPWRHAYPYPRRYGHPYWRSDPYPFGFPFEYGSFGRPGRHGPFGPFGPFGRSAFGDRSRSHRRTRPAAGCR